MLLLTVVEEYVAAAMKRAVSEQMEDGTVGATVPRCPGVIAFGADHHECATELYARLVDWVRVSLAAAHPLPVFDDIDLDAQAAQVLATYHHGLDALVDGDFYGDEHELEAAFAERDSHPEMV